MDPINCQHCEQRDKNVLFCSLSKEGLDIVNAGRNSVKLKKGQYLFRKGEKASQIYCVSSGLLGIESVNPQGKAHLLRVEGPGGITGYRAMFCKGPYEASAVAHEDTQVCSISYEAIDKLFDCDPRAFFIFIQHLSREARDLEKRLCGMFDKSAEERIAEGVLYLVVKFPDHKWTRRDLAEWAGTTPETVMRCLSRFESENLLASQGRKILIKDKNALLDRAQLIH